jgi:hypothetical protein
MDKHQDGIRVDPERMEAITKITLPNNKKKFQSFFQKMNLIRIFIPNFIEITKPISNLLKKDCEFKWDNESIKVDPTKGL